MNALNIKKIYFFLRDLFFFYYKVCDYILLMRRVLLNSSKKISYKKNISSLKTIKHHYHTSNTCFSKNLKINHYFYKNILKDKISDDYKEVFTRTIFHPIFIEKGKTVILNDKEHVEISVINFTSSKKPVNVKIGDIEKKIDVISTGLKNKRGEEQFLVKKVDKILIKKEEFNQQNFIICEYFGKDEKLSEVFTNKIVSIIKDIKVLELKILLKEEEEQKSLDAKEKVETVEKTQEWKGYEKGDEIFK